MLDPITAAQLGMMLYEGDPMASPPSQPLAGLEPRVCRPAGRAAPCAPSICCRVVSAFSGAFDGASCSGGTATQLDGSGVAAVSLSSDLLVKVRCTRRNGMPTACGMLRVAMRATGSQPADFAVATCSSALACVRVPAQALAKLAFAGWLRIQTYVTATTTPITEDLPHNAFFSSGQGQRYLRTP